MAKAEIYIDEQGRRRVNRSPSMGAPSAESQLIERVAALEQRINQMESKVAAAEAKAAKAESDLASLTICGEGFSGSGLGISWSDPRSGNDGGGGDGGEEHDITVITVLDGGGLVDKTVWTDPE